MSTSYQPKEIDLFAGVFEYACTQRPKFNARDKEAAAVRIFYAAENGERDPDRLLKKALAT